jgi:hypothetical protein
MRLRTCTPSSSSMAVSCAYDWKEAKQNWTQATAQRRSSQTLKRKEFIIVSPMRIGWMGIQKKRIPTFIQPLSTHASKSAARAHARRVDARGARCAVCSLCEGCGVRCVRGVRCAAYAAPREGNRRRVCGAQKEKSP